MRATILFLLAIFLCNCTHEKTPHYGWEPLEKGLNNLPSTLAIYKDELYVCGDFDSAGDIKTDLIARWNGQRWASLGKGVKPINDEDAEISIIAMQVFDGKLWVSGTFDSIGNVPAHYVAQWDGASWDTLGGGPIGFGVSTVYFIDQGCASLIQSSFDKQNLKFLNTYYDNIYDDRSYYQDH